MEVHHAAVRGIAAAEYPAKVVEAWAPRLITDEMVEAVRANPEDAPGSDRGPRDCWDWSDDPAMLRVESLLCCTQWGGYHALSSGLLMDCVKRPKDLSNHAWVPIPCGLAALHRGIA